MSDAAIRALARQVGIAVQWTDYANKHHDVSVDALRALLEALGFPSKTSQDLKHSREQLQSIEPSSLIIAAAKHPIHLPKEFGSAAKRGRIIEENGNACDVVLTPTRRGMQLPPIETAGYHVLDLGSRHITLAIAPSRCITIEDLVGPDRVWGPIAQIYGLRSRSDCGIGDAAGLAALVAAMAAQQADTVAISPTHALFTADPTHCSPYSPSSRLFFNPLNADPVVIFGEARVAKAKSAAGAKIDHGSDDAPLIDWPVAARGKLKMFRALFDDFSTTDLSAEGSSNLARDFDDFRATGGAALERHAIFEALHATHLEKDPKAWSWRDWAQVWRRPEGPALADFASKNGREITFHVFLQWLADRSLAASQRSARGAGMRIGVIADVAVGLNRSGSQAWADQAEILGGVEIGAPPDLFNAHGQNWGLTTFGPRALLRAGYRGFINTLRACMRNAGGVRIDHVMGLLRLWLIPIGASASEGAYLFYPLTDLLRLIALESQRHRAIVIGEDLGTVPPGFREKLGQSGIYGMDVLWFERGRAGFTVPGKWSRNAVAMTSTHDLPTVAGWWRGSDLKTRAEFGLLVGDEKRERRDRQRDRRALWKAFTAAKVESGRQPPRLKTARIVDAAIKYVAQTPCPLALVPLEDLLALTPQPNLPGTVDEHPNWRRRYAREPETVLCSPAVRKRFASLAKRGA